MNAKRIEPKTKRRICAVYPGQCSLPDSRDKNLRTGKESILCLLVPLKHEVDGHVDWAWDRLTIQSGGAIFPLFDTVDGCTHEHRVAAYNFDVLNIATFAHDTVQNDTAFHVGSPRQGRIYRYRLLDWYGRLDAAADDRRRSSIRLKQWWRPRGWRNGIRQDRRRSRKRVVPENFV